MQRNGQTFAIYSRKSRYTGKGESIGNQVELCRAYIQTNFGSCAAERAIVFEDEGFSGGNMNRPDFKKMLQRAQQREFRAVVVYRLDRISRNISDFSGLIEELSRLDVAFISIREQFDTGTPMGRAMMYIASVFSQLERETIAERIHDNMHELAKTGRWLGGVTPTGFSSESVRTVSVDGKSKKACKLKLIPHEADIVRLIYELYLKNDSLTATEAELLQRGIKTKNGRSFTRFSIKSILQNPVYLIADTQAFAYFTSRRAELFGAPERFDGLHGILAYNRTDQEKGRATVYRPVEDWIVTVGEHPGLIDGKSWITVQKSLEQNKSKSYRKPRSNHALLTGLLWCTCQNRMYPKLSARQTCSPIPHYTYMCSMKERSKRTVCSSKNADGNWLDHEVLLRIQALQADKTTFIALLEQHKHTLAGTRSDLDRKLQNLHQEQRELSRKITALIDSLADFHDDACKSQIQHRLQELTEQSEQLARQQDFLSMQPEQQPLCEDELMQICKTLTSFSACVAQMSISQKRTALQTLIKRILWTGDSAQVTLACSADDHCE